MMEPIELKFPTKILSCKRNMLLSLVQPLEPYALRVRRSRLETVCLWIGNDTAITIRVESLWSMRITPS